MKQNNALRQILPLTGRISRYLSLLQGFSNLWHTGDKRGKRFALSGLFAIFAARTKQKETMTDPNDFIFTGDLREACSGKYKDYCLHILCLEGSARFEIGDQLFNMIADEVMIKSSAKPVRNLTCSDDLKVEALLISWDYLRKNSPKSEYQVVGYLFTMGCPVYAVAKADIEQLQHDFREIRQRIERPYNNFFDDILRREVELMIFDFYDIQTRNTDSKVKGQSRASELLGRFVGLLQKGLYRENRRIGYYASLLFVSPKYLSEACSNASGNNASYWIEYFTTDALRHELRDTDKSLQDIADEYNFSSVSYFSRYIKEHLHVSPTEYRNRKDKT